MSNPNERLAMAFELHMTDPAILNLSPEVSGILPVIFDTIRRMMLRVINAVTEEQTLEAIFTKLARGDFNTKRKLVAQNRFLKDTFRSKISKTETGRRIASVIDFINRSEYENLLSFGSPELSKIAAQLFVSSVDGTTGETSFINGVERVRNQFVTRIARVSQVLSPEEKAAAFDAHQRGLDPNRNDATATQAQLDAEKEYRKVMDDIYTYQLKANVTQLKARKSARGKTIYVDVPLKKRKNYSPRVWDVAKINGDMAELLELSFVVAEEAAKLGVTDFNTQEKAQAALEAAFNDDQAAIGPDVQSLSEILDATTAKSDQESEATNTSPHIRHARQRVFRFVTNSNIQRFRPWLVGDAEFAMTTYIQQAVNKAEFTRRFSILDENGKVKDSRNTKISRALNIMKFTGYSKQEVKAASRSIQRMLGVYKQNALPRGVRSAVTAAKTFQNLVLLPLILLGNLSDVVILAGRTGRVADAWGALGSGLKGAFTVARDGNLPVDRYIDKLGLVQDDYMMSVLSSSSGSYVVDRYSQKVNRALFRFNGMEGFSQGVRRYAIATIEDIFIDDAKTADFAQLKYFGLKPQDIQVTDDGHIQIEAGNGLTRQQAERVRDAYHRFLDESVFRPNNAINPAYGNDPRFAIFYHLKQFTYAFWNVTVNRVVYEASRGNTQPLWSTLMLVPMAIAMGGVRDVFTGDTYFKDMTASQYIGYGVSRAGLIGPAEYMSSATEGNWGQVLGPTASAVITTATKLGDEDYQGALIRNLPAKDLIERLVYGDR